MNEAGLNARWLRKDMTHEETQTFTKDVLNHMRERLADYQELYGDLYNLEATPAESTSYRLAKHKRGSFYDVVTTGECRIVHKDFCDILLCTKAYFEEKEVGFYKKMQHTASIRTIFASLSTNGWTSFIRFGSSRYAVSAVIISISRWGL